MANLSQSAANLSHKARKAPSPIRRFRSKQGISQQAVADRVGVSKATISAWESGTDLPTPTNAIALCDALPGLTLDLIYRAQRKAA